MRNFFNYFFAYWRRSPRLAFALTLSFLAILISINYTIGIEDRIRKIGPWYLQYGIWVSFYGSVVAGAWLFQRSPVNRGLMRLLAVAVLLFSAKMIHWDLSPWFPGSRGSAANRYWVVVTQLPAKLLLIVGVIWFLWKLGWLAGPAGGGPRAAVGPRAAGGPRAAVGLTTDGFHAAPYFGLLLLLVPLVARACTRPDFLRVYPKVRNIAMMGDHPGPLWLRQAGYELSYGLDFLSIELFFRGLLVIGVVRFAGEKAILPMAAFYCTIHFGKPLAECMTSFAGGLALGVLAYQTRSILGGLIVHLGLAWMMEAMAFLFIFIHSPF